MQQLVQPNEISRDSLVRILEIMHRLAAPEAMPELLREIVEVGKVAIVAEAGVLWLCDREREDLVMVAPALESAPRLRIGQGWAGHCARQRQISNISDCREDTRFRRHPVQLEGFEARSLLNVPIMGQQGAVLGVMQWLGAQAGQFDEHDEWIGPALAAQAAVAIQHAYMTDELLANVVLRQEVALAREIQMSTLPRTMPRVPGYDVHGCFLPTDHAGGDLFDLVLLDGQLFLLLGDATGHGFGPALSATQMQAMLRVAFRLGATLDEAYLQVNNQLVEDLPDDRFITAFLGFLEPQTHRVSYHSAGQGPLLHFHADGGVCEWRPPTRYPMGIMPLEEPERAVSLSLAEGDVLALISDGIYDFQDVHGARFGEEGVARVLREHHALPMAQLTQRLIDAARAFGGEEQQADDITVVLLRRLPAG